MVHYCYDHDEDTDMIYTREIKPLVSGVFDGHDATVVAYGAIASGKTYTIQVVLPFFFSYLVCQNCSCNPCAHE